MKETLLRNYPLKFAEEEDFEEYPLEKDSIEKGLPA
jgi:hypothetical protein